MWAWDISWFANFSSAFFQLFKPLYENGDSEHLLNVIRLLFFAYL